MPSMPSMPTFLIMVVLVQRVVHGGAIVVEEHEDGVDRPKLAITISMASDCSSRLPWKATWKATWELTLLACLLVS